jgi:ABC-type multidrug transport system permease subunit
VFAAIQAAGMIRDKQSGTFARYKFARKSSNGYLLGYTLHTFLITFMQVLLCIGVLLVLQRDFVLTCREGLVLSIIITALSTIYAVVICNLSKSEVQANITASGISAIMSLLGGTFVAIEAMPGLLRLLSLASPIRWVVELLKVL